MHAAAASRTIVTGMPKPRDVNQAWWDERARLHGRDGWFYDIAGFLAGDSAISRRELDELEAAVGSIQGVDLLHLQCHIGVSTLSLARMGARVTGLDFSPEALRRARETADAASLNAEFVEADVLDVPHELHGRFDVVFASYGVLVWVVDLCAWMRSVAASLRPGGKLILVEGHPILTMVQSVDPPVLGWAYQGGEPAARYMPGDYAERGAVTTANDIVMYAHGLGDVVSAAADAGLRVESLTEWLDAEWAPEGGKLVREDDGRYRLAFAGSHLPVEFAVRASKNT